MNDDELLNATARVGSGWTTTNMGENLPGVMNALTWSVWRPALITAAGYAFSMIGALSSSAGRRLDADGVEVAEAFFGRVALNVDFLGEMGDRLPGTSGQAVVEQFFHYVPPEFVSRPRYRRYPVVAIKLPLAIARLPRLARRVRTRTDPWWQAEIARNPALSLDGARDQFRAARRRFEENFSVQTAVAVACTQPAYDLLGKLAARTGTDTDLTVGHGAHEEAQLLNDLWAVSREEMSVADFLARYGFRGAGESDLASHVWREDPAPLLALLAGYRHKSDGQHPEQVERAAVDARTRAERRLLRSLPLHRRLGAAAVLRLGRMTMPLRGVAKVAFVQALDVTRAAARRIGVHLAEQGVIRDPDDVFELTADELMTVPRDARELVDRRRACRTEYERFQLPIAWQSPVEPLVADGAGAGRILTGVGVSGGVVEGTACVVADPGTETADEGDIVVVRSTDPSWVGVIFLAGGLVVDIGGPLSHAAVLARELGIPCVMGTQNGTRVLRTGDRVRVDGRAGTVEILDGAGRESDPTNRVLNGEAP